MTEKSQASDGSSAEPPVEQGSAEVPIYGRKHVDEATERKTRRRIYVLGIMILILAPIGIFLLISGGNRKTRRQAEQRSAQAERGPLVEVARVESSPPFREISLIGESRAFLSASLYARVSGYLREVLVDKGDRVGRGDVLAVVESPETDKAYLAALADFRNRSRIAQRYLILRKRRLVSQQDADQAVAASDISRQTLGTQAVLRGYEQIRAPFSGVITSRLVDPGALIQNGSNSIGAQILFTISKTDRLRIYVYVDQMDAPFVRPGDQAEIGLRDRSDFKIRASVARVAGELDDKTRKLLTEIDIPNVDQRIVAGSFVDVKLSLPLPRYLRVPARALTVRDNATMVPVVGPDDRVHYARVNVVFNDGEDLAIRSGLELGQIVALNLGESVDEGQKVELRRPPMAGRRGREGQKEKPARP